MNTLRADSIFVCGVQGDQNAMGVFFWATDSDINSKFRGVPIVDLPDVNVSVIDAIDGGQTS